jgi:hypothetical protein
MDRLGALDEESVYKADGAVHWKTGYSEEEY